jgi:MoxR-like ATPase
MPIPEVDRSAIESALQRFDAELRNSKEWSDWEKDGNFDYAIDFNGRRYPPKQIVSMATGTSKNQFSGGPPTNSVLEDLGFDVKRIRETHHDASIYSGPQIFVFTAGNAEARSHLKDSIDAPVPSNLCEQHLSHELLDELRSGTGDGDNLYAWGAIPGTQNTPRWGRLKAGDYVLAVSQSRYIRLARLVGKTQNADLARSLWGQDSAGQTWELIYFLTRAETIDVPVGSGITAILPPRYQGFTRIATDSLAKIAGEHGSVDAFVKVAFKPIEPADNYVLIRSNEASVWKDREGTSYHFGSTVPNYTALKPGTHLLIDRSTASGTKIIASAVLGSISAAGVEGSKRLFNATYEEYVPLRPPRHVSDDLAQLIRSLPNFNAQHAVRILTPDLFHRLEVPQPAWIFAGRPDKTDFSALAKSRRFAWLVNAHAERIKVGDRVYLWRTGDQAGIVLVAEVEEPPAERPILATDRKFIIDPEFVAGPRMRAILRVVSPVEPVLSRLELLANQVDQLAVLYAQGGTNFRVTPQEAEVIETLLEPRLRRTDESLDLLVGATSSSLSQTRDEVRQLNDRIGNVGKVAQWWSYPLAQPAQDLLANNPYLYVYVPAPTKMLFFRFHIDQFRSQTGAQGIECPWPEFAKPDEVGKTNIGPRANETFKTWFLVDEITELAEPIGLDGLTATNGAPVEPSVLRNAFAIWRKTTRRPTPSTLTEALADWKPNGLLLSEGVLPGLIATVDSGRHVILTGPPGTGKTRLAKEFAKAASAVGFTSGYVMTTASSDWTTFDTLGGYMPDPEKPNRLQFQRGIVLDAIATNRWLILDEINRADADKAFGALLTVLAGFDTTISFKNEQGIRFQLRVGETSDCSVDDEAGVFTIGKNWRVIATMNTRDKNSLYALSYAFMRRFSFVYVGPPDAGPLAALLATNVSDVNARTTALKIAECCPGLLGPAILIDIGKLIQHHHDQALGAVNAVTAYVIPQFEGRQPKEIADNLRLLSKRLNLGSEAVQQWSAAAGVLVGAPVEAAEVPQEEEPAPDLGA